MLCIGRSAPEFVARTTFGERRLSDLRGRWLVFFSHPADFTPVCTSEFVAFARMADAFAAEGCDLLALSVDSLHSHLAWVRSIRERFGIAIPFPVVEDPSMAIARAYGMIDETSQTSATVRASFVIDPDGIIRAMSWYPMTTGRNVAEILRAVRALRVADATGASTPEGWQPGHDLIDTGPLPEGEALPVSEWLYRTRSMEAAE